MRSLRATQRWFQREVVRLVDGGSQGAWAPDHVVLPSRTLKPAERMAIYSQAYFLRLEECLAQDFQAIRHVLGEEHFRRLATAYLRAHPSRHYSLNPLGRDLPRFLQGSIQLPHKEVLRDLALLEWTMTRLMDLPEPLAPAASEILGHLTPETIVESRVRLNPTLHLFAFATPANAIVTAIRKGRPIPPLTNRRTWLAVYRKDFSVWRMDLSEAMFGLLVGLSRGRSFGRALEETQARWQGTPEQLRAAVFQSLRSWTAERFFADVIDGSNPPDGVARRSGNRSVISHKI